MQITDYIHTYPFAISPNLADEVINHYHINGQWNQSSFSTNEGISPRSKERVDMKEYWINKQDKFYEELKTGFRSMVDDYIKTHTKIIPQNFTPFRMNHYSKGGFMKNHIDNIHHSHGQQYGYPHVTALIFLQTADEGGEIVFCDGEYIPEQTKGSGVVFPSNFMFSHEVKKVIKGDRYSLMTWIL
jgi:predicted 2-oxoglutarate/Fe(II)-dependent dioxygenase YbiX